MLTTWLQKFSAPIAPKTPPPGAEPIRSDVTALVQTALHRLPHPPLPALLTPTLAQFAVYAQRLPDAKGQHTLWDSALAEANTQLVESPRSDPSHAQSTAQTNNNYQRIAHALLHQAAASVSHWRVELLDETAAPLGDWIPTYAPMTGVEAAVFYRVYRRHTMIKSELNLDVLALMLAPTILPPAGLDSFVYGLQQVECEPSTAPISPSPDTDSQPKSAAQATARTTATTVSKPAQHAALASALQLALKDFMQALIEHNALNTLQGSAWLAQDGLYIIGKEAAAALRQHPALADWKAQFQKNTVLYRALHRQGLTERCADKPIWTIRVSDGCDSRKVAAIKMPLADSEMAVVKQHPPFSGVLTVPGQRNVPSEQAKHSAQTASPVRSQQPGAPAYTTLFDEHVDEQDS